MESASAYVSTPVVFFTPHQDDEALFMGAAIKQHVLAGRKVYVTLMTDGGSSRICTTNFSSRAACVAARDAEFIAGVKSLGAIPIIRPDRAIDGKLTVAYAKRIVEAYYALPGWTLGSFKTMAEYDGHLDHANLGKGLRAAVGPTDKRWYIRTEQWPTHAGTFTPQYDINSTLDLYIVGHLSVPTIFDAVTYPKGAYSKNYK